MHIQTIPALLASVMTIGVLTAACSEDKWEETPDRDELYARDFIKDFGVPDPDHDWSMATTAGLRVKTSSSVNLKVFAEIDGTRYIFADIPGFKGESGVPVTIPKNVEQLIVAADDREYLCSPSATLDLDNARPADAGRVGTVNITDNKYSYDITITSNNPTTTSSASFEIDDNPAIKTILTTPFESKYLQTTSDQGIPFGPFFGNGPFTLAFGQNDFWPKDWEIFPLWIGDDSKNTVIGIALGNSTSSKCYSRYDLPAGQNYYIAPYGISSVDHATNKYEYSPCPDLSNRLINLERISVKYTHPGYYSTYAPYISYYIKRTNSNNSYNRENEASAFRISYSFAPYNYYQADVTVTNGTISGWGDNYYDAPLKDMNTCYSTCLYFKNVPIKWKHNGSTATETDLVQIFALYDAPTSPAQQRPDKPFAYILEYHDETVSYLCAPYKEKTYYSYQWTILAEDLGGSHDWDFNDIVFSVSDVITKRQITDIISTDGDEYGTKDYPYSPLYPKNLPQGIQTVREVTVTPLAAGGTLPVYIGWKGKTTTSFEIDGNILLSDIIKNGSYTTPVEKEGDFIIGAELHHWLKSNTHTIPLNVGDKITHTGKPVKFYIPNDEDWYPTGYYGLPASLLGFYAIVDPNGTLGIDTSENFDPLADDTTEKTGLTPFDPNSRSDGYIVAPPDPENKSKTPQMFVSWNNFQWPKESINIGEGYPNFHLYVADHNAHPMQWAAVTNSDLLVPRP